MKNIKNRILLISLISVTSFTQWSFALKRNSKTTQKTTATKETAIQGEVINRIDIVAYTDSDSPIIITAQESDRKALDGQKKSQKEVLYDRLKFYDATEYYKISGYQEDAEKHLKAIKAEHNLDDGQLHSIFKESGYTLEEGRKELEMTYAIRRLMQELVVNRVIPTEKEIKEYYEKNPVHVAASYKVKKGTVKKSILSQEQIKDITTTGKHKEEIVWGASYWINEDELAEHKKFITKMSVQSIALSEMGDDEYEFVQLLKTKPARIKTLEERYNEIVQILRYPKYEKYMKEYEEELLKKYDVVYY